MDNSRVGGPMYTDVGECSLDDGFRKVVARIETGAGRLCEQRASFAVGTDKSGASILSTPAAHLRL